MLLTRNREGALKISFGFRVASGLVNFKAARFVPDQELPKVIAIRNKVTYSVASPPITPHWNAYSQDCFA
jgi:hypothetical protein